MHSSLLQVYLRFPANLVDSLCGISGKTLVHPLSFNAGASIQGTVKLSIRMDFPTCSTFFNIILSDTVSSNLAIYFVTTSRFSFSIVRMGRFWKSEQPAYVRGWPSTTVRAGTLEP